MEVQLPFTDQDVCFGATDSTQIEHIWWDAI
jgi:hypothetical protein